MNGIIVPENAVFKYIAVKLGHAVYGVRSRKAEVCHFDLVAVHNGVVADLAVVPRELLPKLAAETGVDFADDLENPRQKTAEQVLRPFFQSFRHNGVVGI